MLWKIPEPESPLETLAPRQWEKRFTLERFSKHLVRIRNGPFVKPCTQPSGTEAESLQDANMTGMASIHTYMINIKCTARRGEVSSSRTESSRFQTRFH
ncbi:hypothetical protein AVEN_264763-1 [Araneus ventricosus]|uniref:Uncharacterized protein n=1 Tax=Araneus ventricosus TaxID=182803 RepID=A0A4Y2EF69_ARAVE|nr:hypothetical protein AVEN_264763-1 [Araneus ventricosus]